VYVTGKSHLTIGVVTYVSVWLGPLGPVMAPLFGGSRAALALPAAGLLVAFGALLPDIDHPRGALAQEEIAGVPVFKPLAWGIGTLFGHRGPTHSLLALAVVILFGQWPWAPWERANIGWLIGWGYASHLAADALTKSGVPLFWPLAARFGFPPVRALRLVTGSWREGVVVWLLTLACLLNVARPFLG
jgi:inner membrane protein